MSQTVVEFGAGIPAPNLSIVGVDIFWTWELPDPPFWYVETSTNGVDYWNLVRFDPGDTRQAADMEPGFFYRVSGTTAESEPVTRTTGISNVVATA